MSHTEQLNQVYIAVVEGWAVSTNDVAEITGLPKDEVKKMLNLLATKKLVDSIHVNGERQLTWQSDFDIENEDNVLDRAEAAFAEAFPTETDEPTSPAKNHATGPRYTNEQLAKAAELRNTTDMSWSAIAAELNIKTPYRLAKKVKELEGEVRIKRATKSSKPIGPEVETLAHFENLLRDALAEKRTSGSLKARIREALV